MAESQGGSESAITYTVGETRLQRILIQDRENREQRVETLFLMK